MLNPLMQFVLAVILINAGAQILLTFWYLLMHQARLGEAVEEAAKVVSLLNVAVIGISSIIVGIALINKVMT